MAEYTERIALILVLLACPSYAHAFLDCEDQQGGSALSGNNRYSVSELEFDATSRQASGTVTHYHYRDSAAGDLTDCHVTYELSGVFEQSSALFLLEGSRTNLSHNCDSEFVEALFPAYRSYTLQVLPTQGDSAIVVMADNGDAIATAERHPGYLTFKTHEACESL